MTNSPEFSTNSGVFLVAPAGRIGSAAAQLAQLCQWRLLPDWPGDLADCNPSFQALTAEAPGWLQPLALDPGRTISGWECWAEALGAWRIPTCLVCSDADRAAGLARSHWALLRHYRVPLLGLIQAGGHWSPADRRAEGLPWLGHLGDQEASAELRLRLIAASGAAAAAPPAPASMPSH